MKLKNLNTAVKVTMKGGQSYVYESIEVASEMTGLSVLTLKIRANKNSIPKDGILVEWLDEHTKKHYTAKRSKQKGLESCEYNYTPEDIWYKIVGIYLKETSNSKYKED